MQYQTESLWHWSIAKLSAFFPNLSELLLCTNSNNVNTGFFCHMHGLMCMVDVCSVKGVWPLSVGG